MAAADSALLPSAPPTFAVVTGAGSWEADGVYRCCGRLWLGLDVLENLVSDCLISREAQTSGRTGCQRHGFVLGLAGRALYGVRTEASQIPSCGWRTLGGAAPSPQVRVFASWAEACSEAAAHFGCAAAAKTSCGDLSAAHRLGDFAVACLDEAKPARRRLDFGRTWTVNMCDLLALRAEALLRVGEPRLALLDACRSVGYIDAFEWSRARTRGVAACLALGVNEEQAQLLMEEAGRRDAPWQPPDARAGTSMGRTGDVHDDELALWVDALLESALRAELSPVVLEDDTPDDGRIYYRVLDPEDCLLRSAPSFSAERLGLRSEGDIVRGERVVQAGAWLELHISESWDVSEGHERAYMPIFSDEACMGADSNERDELMQRLPFRHHPSRTKWELLGLTVRPLGLKPSADADWLAHWWDEERAKNQGRWPFDYKQRLAVAAVVHRAPVSVIDSFVRYHWGAGFNHVALYFDDPDDPGVEVARALERVCLDSQSDDFGMAVIRMDSQWWARARASSRFYRRRETGGDLYESVCERVDEGHFEGREVVAVDIAVMAARAAGVSWFVPLRIDECVYAPPQQDGSIRRFFASLPSAVLAVRLWSHEALPAAALQEPERQDWFRECTQFLFALQHCGFPVAREYDAILRRREGREFEPLPSGPLDGRVEWWKGFCGEVRERRLPVAQALGIPIESLPPAFFTAAGTSARGRSAVRLDKLRQPPLPQGVRTFIADNGDLLQEYHQATGSNDAVVLHYPAVDFSYWQDQLTRSHRDPAAAAGPAAASVDPAVAAALRRLPRESRERYFDTFLRQDAHSELAVLAEHGLVQTIGGVRELLAFLDKPGSESEEFLPGQQQWRHQETGRRLATPDGRF